MSHQAMSRRSFLAKAGLAASTTVLAACQPKVVEKIVKETVVVTQEKLVKETVVVKEAVEVQKEVTRVVEKAVPASQVITLRMVTRRKRATMGASLRKSSPNCTPIFRSRPRTRSMPSCRRSRNSDSSDSAGCPLQRAKVV